MKLTINLASLTLGEVEELEERIGVPAGELMLHKPLPMKAIRAMVYLQLRREDPSVTWESTADIVIASIEYENPAATANAPKG